MTWYAAHIIEVIKINEDNQPNYPVYENIVLIEADSVENALAKAQEIGRKEYDHTDDSLRVNGHPASSIFSGVRKIVECQNSISSDSTDVLEHGTEVTHLRLSIDADDLSEYISGKTVSLIYEGTLEKPKIS